MYFFTELICIEINDKPGEQMDMTVVIFELYCGKLRWDISKH